MANIDSELSIKGVGEIRLPDLAEGDGAHVQIGVAIVLAPLSCVKGDISDSKAYEILGLSSDARRHDVKQAFTRLVKLYHPDRKGDPELFRQLKIARDLLLKKLKSRGRPRKYQQIQGYAIVDRNKENKICWQFKTRKEAQKFLKGLAETAEAAPSLGGANLIIVGNAAAERQRKRRLLKKQFINDPSRGMGQGKYMAGAGHSEGLLITGGYDGAKLSQVDAAHQSERGGPNLDAPPWRRSGAEGHGPDADEVDETADSGDTDSFVSSSWDDENELEFQASPVTAEGGRDELLGPSDEDRALPVFEGFDKPPLEDSDYETVLEDGEPTEFIKPRVEDGRIEKPLEARSAPSLQECIQESYEKLKLRKSKSALAPKQSAPILEKSSMTQLDNLDELKLPTKAIELPSVVSSETEKVSRLIKKRKNKKVVNLLI